MSMLALKNNFLKKDNESLSLQIEHHVNQIRLLEKKSKVHEEKVILASSIAAKNFEKRSIEANEILNQKVSSDCENAIAWGINQASAL
jgi:hypothetical protein